MIAPISSEALNEQASSLTSVITCYLAVEGNSVSLKGYIYMTSLESARFTFLTQRILMTMLSKRQKDI